MVYSKNDYLIDMVEDLNFYLQSTGLTKCVRGDNIDLFKEDGGHVFATTSIEHCVAFLKGITYVTGV